MANTPLSREIGGDIMEYYRVAGAAPSPMAAPNTARDLAAEIDALRARVERLEASQGKETRHTHQYAHLPGLPYWRTMCVCGAERWE